MDTHYTHHGNRFDVTILTKYFNFLLSDGKHMIYYVLFALLMKSYIKYDICRQFNQNKYTKLNKIMKNFLKIYINKYITNSCSSIILYISIRIYLFANSGQKSEQRNFFYSNRYS